VIISVASGKGGTGKTTVAASLASVIPESVYIDCDVEEPNGHLLLQPEFTSEEAVDKLLPKIDYGKCNFCGKCTEVCEFNALINLRFEIVINEEMCHSCGACIHFCPERAISVRLKEIGIVRIGANNDRIIFSDGLLNIGEVSAVPLIKEVKKKIIDGKINIIDSPPGTSCSMVEAVKDSLFCVLVTESTPFGLNDLKLAVEVMKAISIPFGVVINKYIPSFTEMENYLNETGIEILLKIPFDRKTAEFYSKGVLPVSVDSKLKNDFLKMYERISGKIELEKVDAAKII
jgi:MinD superfamily P-loop ATPase